MHCVGIGHKLQSARRCFVEFEGLNCQESNMTTIEPTFITDGPTEADMTSEAASVAETSEAMTSEAMTSEAVTSEGATSEAASSAGVTSMEMTTEGVTAAMTSDPVTAAQTTALLCVPTNDCTGHYNCTDNVKVCLPGYSGDDCNTKGLGVGDVDPECAGDSHTADQTCTGRGYCFEESCCCEDPQYDNNNLCNDLNECLSDPCLNGGTCNNDAGSYNCECASGEYSFTIVTPNSGYYFLHWCLSIIFIYFYSLSSFAKSWCYCRQYFPFM